MVGNASGTCECGVTRAPFSQKSHVCSFDGFDHLEEWCCQCLLSRHNWRYFEEDSCRQCKIRQLVSSPYPALEAQRPFSLLMLEGKKSIETRAYCIPDQLLGRPIAIIESAEGAAGVSALPSLVAAGHPGLHIAGTVVFGSCFQYESYAQWEADAARHLVESDSEYRFMEGGSAKYGWVVQEYTRAAEPQAVPSMRRRFRSLFVCDP